MAVDVPPACTTLTGTVVLRFEFVDHHTYTSYVPGTRFGVHRYLSVPVPQLNSESVPKKLVAPEMHQLPVNVRPPAASCTPAGALSRMTSPAAVPAVMVNV